MSAPGREPRHKGRLQAAIQYRHPTQSGLQPSSITPSAPTEKVRPTPRGRPQTGSKMFQAALLWGRTLQAFQTDSQRPIGRCEYDVA